jgi:hypothetical protein
MSFYGVELQTKRAAQLVGPYQELRYRLHSSQDHVTTQAPPPGQSKGKAGRRINVDPAEEIASQLGLSGDTRRDRCCIHITRSLGSNSSLGTAPQQRVAVWTVCVPRSGLYLVTSRNAVA